MSLPTRADIAYLASLVPVAGGLTEARTLLWQAAGELGMGDNEAASYSLGQAANVLTTERQQHVIDLAPALGVSPEQADANLRQWATDAQNMNEALRWDNEPEPQPAPEPEPAPRAIQPEPPAAPEPPVRATGRDTDAWLTEENCLAIMLTDARNVLAVGDEMDALKHRLRDARVIQAVPDYGLEDDEPRCCWCGENDPLLIAPDLYHDPDDARLTDAGLGKHVRRAAGLELPGSRPLHEVQLRLVEADRPRA